MRQPPAHPQLVGQHPLGLAGAPGAGVAPGGAAAAAAEGPGGGHHHHHHQEGGRKSAGGGRPPGWPPGAVSIDPPAEGYVSPVANIAHLMRQRIRVWWPDDKAWYAGEVTVSVRSPCGAGRVLAAACSGGLWDEEVVRLCCWQLSNNVDSGNRVGKSALHSQHVAGTTRPHNMGLSDGSCTAALLVYFSCPPHPHVYILALPQHYNKRTNQFALDYDDGQQEKVDLSKVGGVTMCCAEGFVCWQWQSGTMAFVNPPQRSSLLCWLLESSTQHRPTLNHKSCSHTLCPCSCMRLPTYLTPQQQQPTAGDLGNG